MWYHERLVCKCPDDQKIYIGKILRVAPSAHIRPSILRVLGITLSFIGVWVGDVGYQGPWPEPELELHAHN